MVPYKCLKDTREQTCVRHASRKVKKNSLKLNGLFHTNLQTPSCAHHPYEGQHREHTNTQSSTLRKSKPSWSSARHLAQCKCATTFPDSWSNRPCSLVIRMVPSSRSHCWGSLSWTNAMHFRKDLPTLSRVPSLTLPFAKKYCATAALAHATSHSCIWIPLLLSLMVDWFR